MRLPFDRSPGSWTLPRPLTAARIALCRRPWVFWVLVVAAAVVIGLIVGGSVRAFQQQRESWGDTVDVLVTTRELAPGDRLDDAVVMRSVPVAVAPDDAVSEIPAGAVARQRAGRGEMLSDHDLSGGEGRAGLAPQGWRVVAVVEPISSGVDVGTPVSVAADGAVLAAQAVVAGRHGDAVLVAVPPADAPAVAAAAVEARAALLVGTG